MGTYIYTCRSEKKVIDGVIIGRFTFAYKYSGRDGWAPQSRDSNRFVKSIEARAQKARANFSGERSLFVMAPDLTMKGLQSRMTQGRLAVYAVPRHTYQVIEHFNGEPVGHLSMVNGKMTYTPVAA